MTKAPSLRIAVFLLLIATAYGGYTYPYYYYPTQKPTPIPTPTVKASTTVSASQFLAPHNAARKAVGLKPLVWDARLEQYARWWAGQRRNDCQLEHSSGPYGENIFWGSGAGWAPAQAVAAWVAEKRSYRLGSNSCSGVCGHYTQIVWRETRRIGCASVTCGGNRGTFITCNYDPAGNYLNQRPY